MGPWVLLATAFSDAAVHLLVWCSTTALLLLRSWTIHREPPAVPSWTWLLLILCQRMSLKQQSLKGLAGYFATADEPHVYLRDIKHETA
jgi:hypothetical protein